MILTPVIKPAMCDVILQHGNIDHGDLQQPCTEEFAFFKLFSMALPCRTCDADLRSAQVAPISRRIQHGPDL